MRLKLFFLLQELLICFPVCCYVCLSLGMMIETMAGKSAALHGLCHDCTPFTFSEDSPAVDYFGKLLVKGSHELVKTNNSRLNGRHWRATQSDSSSCCINIDHLVTSKTFTPSPGFSHNMFFVFL